MRLLWVDAGQGAAGDMFLAALLDAGADEAAVRAGLAGLPIDTPPIDVQQVRRHGLRACRVDVPEPEQTHPRGLSEILSLLTAAGLPSPVTSFATAVFRRLGTAEAAVHGVPVEDVHFHEVGAIDAIVDIVGCSLALHSLGFLTATKHATMDGMADGAVSGAADGAVSGAADGAVSGAADGAVSGAAGGTVSGVGDVAGAHVVVSPIAVGSGTVRACHGVLPVPAPAVLNLLVGAPIAAHHATMELCTPTGAALLTTLAHRWGPLPACVPQRIGVGAGSRDPAGHPNVVRVVLAEYEPTGDAHRHHEEHLTVVEATVDDLDPRLWPDVLEAMRAAGALDAWCSPILAHKGRPGQVLTVLSPPERLDAVCRTVFAHTTTLGLRRYPVQRLALQRDQVVRTYRGHPISVKRGLLDGRVVSAQPEYDDLRRAARATGAPVREVLAAVTGGEDLTATLG